MNVMAGLRRAGVYPFNPQAITFTGSGGSDDTNDVAGLTNCSDNAPKSPGSAHIVSQKTSRKLSSSSSDTDPAS